MAEVDKLMQEQLMPFYKRLECAFIKGHSPLYSIVEKIMSNKKIHIGMRITSNGSTIGEYTLHFNGTASLNTTSGWF